MPLIHILVNSSFNHIWGNHPQKMCFLLANMSISTCFMSLQTINISALETAYQLGCNAHTLSHSRQLNQKMNCLSSVCITLCLKWYSQKSWDDHGKIYSVKAALWNFKNVFLIGAFMSPPVFKTKWQSWNFLMFNTYL